MATREPIYVALFNLVTQHPTIQAIFVQTGRFLYHHSQVPGGAMPAMYFIEHPGESHVRPGKGIDPKRTLRCNIVMYFSEAAGAPGGSGIPPSTACNNALDALDDLLNIPGNPSNAQTLGGLVEHVYMEGEIAIAEGLLQTTSIVTVPINMLIP